MTSPPRLEEDNFDQNAKTISLRITDSEPCKTGSPDVMDILQAIQDQLKNIERDRANDMREWAHWRGSINANITNLSERIAELTRMYAQAIEVLPIAKRTEDHVGEILNWMSQGGHTAKHRT